MYDLNHYGIPVFGIDKGIRHFEFKVDDQFFKNFEDSPIQSGTYKVFVECDKRDNEFVLDFRIEGDFDAPCDRCLADIKVPSSINKMVWVQYSMEGQKESSDEDLIFIEEADHVFNIGSLIYEFIVLSIPMVKKYDCENDPDPKCDFKVLSYLDNEIEEESDRNDFADKLNKLKNL